MNFEDYDLSDDAVQEIEQIENELIELDQRQKELREQIGEIVDREDPV